MTQSPRDIRRQRAREAIVAAGRKLVARHGARNLSLRAVAKEAHYSPAAIYEYFASKEELVAALTADVAAGLARALAEVPAELPPRERLVALGLAYVEFALAPPADFALMFQESRSRRRSLQEPIGTQDAYGILARAVRSALGGADADAVRVEAISYALWSLAHGMATLQLTHLAGFDADFATADRAALTALVEGFLREPAAAGGTP